MGRGWGSSEILRLLGMLDEAYSMKTWHGPNLKGSLRGLTAAAAAWKPGPKRHSIWEIAVHAAYWKYVARRRLLGEKRGSFALKGSNWFARPSELSEKAWKADLALLDQEHARLREAVAGLKPASLNYTPSNSRVSNLALIYGIANHDVYHAGQIQLLKRLQEG
jgi:hypothetical protein